MMREKEKGEGKEERSTDEGYGEGVRGVKGIESFFFFFLWQEG